MSNISPIFPINEPQHFSDYGFDPQIDYYQVLEEARKHRRDPSSRSIDIHFKLQKPISKDESSKKIKKNKKKWWLNALLFFKFDKWAPPAGGGGGRGRASACELRGGTRARIGSISGPVYITESRSGSSTPYRNSGELMKGEVDIPYISLRELNMDQEHRISTSAMPIYLVT